MRPAHAPAPFLRIGPSRAWRVTEMRSAISLKAPQEQWELVPCLAKEVTLYASSLASIPSKVLEVASDRRIMQSLPRIVEGDLALTRFLVLDKIESYRLVELWVLEVSFGNNQQPLG